MFLNQLLGQIVESGIHVLSALGRPVSLSQLHILIDAHSHGYLGERDYLGQCQLHHYTVHEGHAIDFPSSCGGSYHTQVCGLSLYCIAKQTCGKGSVLFITIFGLQRLGLYTFFSKLLDGLEHEGVHDGLVVIPVDIHLFQDVIQSIIVADKLPVGLTPHFTVAGIRILRLQILFIDGALLYLCIEGTHEVFMISPGYLLVCHIIQQLLVVFQLGNEAIPSKAPFTQIIQSQATGSVATHLLHTEPHSAYLHHQ